MFVFTKQVRKKASFARIKLFLFFVSIVSTFCTYNIAFNKVIIAKKFNHVNVFARE